MASHPPGTCCKGGFKHEGDPAGETKSVRGIDTYIVYPEQTREPKNAVIIFSDVFGIYGNTKLLADEFAVNGYLTVIPDLFRGDAMNFDDANAGKIKFNEWLSGHPPHLVDPVVKSIIEYVKDDLGCNRVAAAGYCFGAKYVCRFLKSGQLDVGYIAHPSAVTDEELRQIRSPLSIAAAEIDWTFPAELRHSSELILAQTGHPWQIQLFSGVEHGFAVRGDLSNKTLKFAKEQAFYQATAWFKHHL